MCTKGNPSTTTGQSQSGTASGTSNTSQTQNSAQNSAQNSSSSLAPNADTLALYQQFLNQAQGLSTTPYNPLTAQQVAPWTDAQGAATTLQFNRGNAGVQGMGDARNLVNAGAAPVSGNIAGLASSLNSANPYSQAAVDYGLSQGQAIGNWGTSHGQGVSDYATALAARGPQLQQFSQGAIDQYMSPYIQDVVNTTQNQFNNQNAIQGNSLIGQAIRSGNAFGGDRAGVGQAQLAGQQQIAQAPVIAGLYNTGYNTALGEFNTQNQLAAQLGQMAINGQVAGGNMGLQGLTSGAQTGLAGYGLGMQGYRDALSTASNSLQADANRQVSAGGLLGNLNLNEFNSNLVGGQSAMAASDRWPAYLQSGLNAYQANQAAQSAYPFQTSGWYGNILGGVGPLTGSNTTGSQSGTQSGTQSGAGSATTAQTSNSTGSGVVTPPQPSGWSQALGAVGTIAGLPFGPAGSTVGGTIGTGVGKLFGKDGGMVPRARGGGIDGETPFSGAPYSAIRFPGGTVQAVHGYIPTLDMPRGNLLTPSTNDFKLQAAPVMSMPNVSLPNLSLPNMDLTPKVSSGTTPTSGIGSIANFLGNKGVQQGISGLGLGGNADSPMFKPGFMGTGSLYARGGLVDDDNEGDISHYLAGRPEIAGGLQHFAFGGLYGDDDTSDPTSTNVLGDNRPPLYDSPAGPETPLSGLRKRYEPELQNPRIMNRLIGLTHAEVGNQGPEAQQALMETIFNRAASRGQTLDRAMQTDYYPGLGNINRVSPEQQAAFRGMLPQVLSGSNVGNYATGNASGTVGFAGGPQVAAYGGERFGIEGPDRTAMRDIAGGDVSALPEQAQNAQFNSGSQGYVLPTSGLTNGQVIRPPAQERPQGDFLNRWLSNPMTQFGIAILQSRSPYVSEAIGQGLTAATKTSAAQLKSDLDAKPELVNLGGQMAWKMADGSHITTGLPSPEGMKDAREREKNATNELYRRDVLQERSDQKAADRVAKEDLAKIPKVKPIPSSIQKDLGTKASNLGQLESLGAGFQPEYAGAVSETYGDLKNWVARQAGIGNKNAAEWWQDYDRYKTNVRHDLFGSALTKTEQAQWSKVDVNPGMQPDLIKKNIENQTKIISGAIQRRAKSLAAQGYSKEAIEAEIGRTIEDAAPQNSPDAKAPPSPERAAPAAPSAPAAPTQGEIMPGKDDKSYRFKGGDRYDKKNWEPVT